MGDSAHSYNSQICALITELQVINKEALVGNPDVPEQAVQQEEASEGTPRTKDHEPPPRSMFLFPRRKSLEEPASKIFAFVVSFHFLPPLFVKELRHSCS